MGRSYLIDSNAVIDYLMGKLPASGMAFLDDVINEVPNVSVITQIEVLGFNSPDETDKLLHDFFSDAIILGLTDEVVDKTIELRKARKIKLPTLLLPQPLSPTD